MEPFVDTSFSDGQRLELSLNKVYQIVNRIEFDIDELGEEHHAQACNALDVVLSALKKMGAYEND